MHVMINCVLYLQKSYKVCHKKTTDHSITLGLYGLKMNEIYLYAKLSTINQIQTFLHQFTVMLQQSNMFRNVSRQLSNEGPDGHHC